MCHVFTFHFLHYTCFPTLLTRYSNHHPMCISVLATSTSLCQFYCFALIVLCPPVPSPRCTRWFLTFGFLDLFLTCTFCFLVCTLHCYCFFKFSHFVICLLLLHFGFSIGYLLSLNEMEVSGLWCSKHLKKNI